LDKKIILLILLVAVASSLGTAYSLGGTNIIFRTSPDGISSNEVMRITSDGKVGIGTITPQSTLDVNGTLIVNEDLTVNGFISSPTTLYLEYALCTNFNRYAELAFCNLSGLGLFYLDLSFTNLIFADLSGTDFTETLLIGADLLGANLAGADFTNVDLYHANLDWTYLEGANFQGADLTGITYVDCVGTPIGIPALGTLPVCGP
jgi:uncharacterized protein YjbI with pentapeptide repeats